MMNNSDLQLAISDKLGWDAMLASVATPAINRIIEVSGIQDIEVMESFSDTELFTCLGFPFNSLSEIKDFQNLRYEIEREMFHGASYQDAINEWFK